MTKNISIRFAWHDDKWDGGICRDPRSNVYCTGNYSLLSPRLQRRIEINHEEKQKNKALTEVVSNNYLPPCFWCINALGNEKCTVDDFHPFSDTSAGEKDFEDVPPLKTKITEHSVYSWCFKLGWSDGGIQRYVTPEELKRRTDSYLYELKPNRSIAFFYANYSNPVTADDYKYLLLGAGIISNYDPSHNYNIPTNIVNKIRSRFSMGNFPTQAWQFHLQLQPESTFVLPYHEYLDWINRSDDIESDERWHKLEEMAIPINERTIIPHFKYVSMHLPHDKAIYLLYQMKKSLRNIEEHGLLEHQKLAETKKKIDKMLTIAWEERGEYPGLRNTLHITLKDSFSEDYLERELLDRILDYVKKTWNSTDHFLKTATSSGLDQKATQEIGTALRIIYRKLSLIQLLARFDFTIPQLKNIEDLIGNIGLDNLKRNPYLILERYHNEHKENWDIDQTDFGIGLYQIDTALIPDPEYTKWTTGYDAHSPERIRALITKILSDAAIHDGNSFLTRDEILVNIADYPLYYILNKFQVDSYLLSEYEKQSVFKDKFFIQDDVRENEVRYQLKMLKEAENIIENFFEKMNKKKIQFSSQEVDVLVQRDIERWGDKLNVKERKELYTNMLGNGLYILSGKAGSGKTQAVVNLIESFHRAKSSVFVFTPTGKANLVILNRLKSIGLNRSNNIRVSTIHRFLFRGLFDYYGDATLRKQEMWGLQKQIERILDNQWEFLEQFKAQSRRWQFNPKVVIIDESSMVDEILLATLLLFINTDRLEHLILVGDDKQLPPIGLGRPFADAIFNLKQKWSESNSIQLRTNLRFNPSTSIGSLAEVFSSEDEPSPAEIEHLLNKTDETINIDYFSDLPDLEKSISRILSDISHSKISPNVFDGFSEVFESGGELNLDKIQIIIPRRVGEFGSMAVNQNLVMEGDPEVKPKTKLICEENMYFDAGDKRVLGLANGSIGYIKEDGSIHFEEFDDLRDDYGRYLGALEKRVMNEVYENIGIEKKIDFAYAITVHKAQGSDFEHVILILSEMSPFITKELLYTVITRPRTKLYILVNEKLKKELPSVLVKAYLNSAVEQRKTLLFGHKASPFKPYKLTMTNGQQLDVHSKIEYMIAKNLDALGVSFEYDVSDFEKEYHLRPDFKITIADKIYYWEHLGNIGPKYANRWSWKIGTYKNIGIFDSIITTSESETPTDIQNAIATIISDLKNDKLIKTEGSYSNHHYYV